MAHRKLFLIRIGPLFQPESAVLDFRMEAPSSAMRIVDEPVEKDVLQLSKISKRATGWVGQTPSHAATWNRWLMN